MLTGGFHRRRQHARLCRYLEWASSSPPPQSGDQRERTIEIRTKEESKQIRTKDEYKMKMTEKMKDQPQPKMRSEYLTALAFSPDGKSLAAAVHFQLKVYDPIERDKVLRQEEENVVRRWEVTTGKQLPPWPVTPRRSATSSFLLTAKG